MEITLTGILAWVYAAVTVAISGSLMILGALLVWNRFILIPLLNHFKFSQGVYEYFRKKELIDEELENIEQRKNELRILEISHHEAEWLYCIGEIIKGEEIELLLEYRDVDWINKIINVIREAQGAVKPDDYRDKYEMNAWNDCLKGILCGRRTTLIKDPEIDQEMVRDACEYLGYAYGDLD